MTGRTNVSVTMMVCMMAFISVSGAWAQFDFGNDTSLEYVEPIRGDMEISNIGQPDEEIVFYNPETSGTVELEIGTKGNVISIIAESIKVTGGKSRIHATGGVVIDDGTTSIKGQTANVMIKEGKVDFSGNAAFAQKLDRDRNNSWKGEKIEAWFGDGGVSRIKLSGGKSGRLYPEKGQMSRFLSTQKDDGSKKKSSAPQQPVQAPKEKTIEPEAEPQKLERILAPMAE